jgi:hypothetical protein
MFLSLKYAKGRRAGNRRALLPGRSSPMDRMEMNEQTNLKAPEGLPPRKPLPALENKAALRPTRTHDLWQGGTRRIGPRAASLSGWLVCNFLLSPEIMIENITLTVISVKTIMTSDVI